MFQKSSAALLFALILFFFWKWVTPIFMGNFLAELFLTPVLKLAFSEALLILAFAITFDFGWQFAFRVFVILIARVHQQISHILFIHRQITTGKISNKIKTLESKLSQVEGNTQVEFPVLKKLAALRTRLRALKASIALSEEEYKPFVSIIIPCHNSSKVIDETLKQVLNLEYENKEIIVVDDGSTDNTYEIASKYKQYVNVVRRSFCSGRKTGAINFGLAFTSGDVIVVIDDDTIVEKNSLNYIVKPLFDTSVAGAGANIRIFSNNSNLITKLQEIEYMIIMQLVKPFQAYFFKAVLIISGSYGAFKKKYLERIGGWDIDIITEDLDLTWKLYRLKKRVMHSERSVCYTDVPSTFKDLVKQRNRWDYGLFETISKHKSFIFSKRFPALGFGLLPESVFFEIITIAARPFYILVLIILTGMNLLSIFLLIIYFYLFLEFSIIFCTGLLSRDKKLCLKAIYAPAMLVYHQFLAVIRIRALWRFATKKGVEW